ncbi:DUF1990 domain-containing protein (plasmid) [Deinococcus wulumuqiensis]|uniref:DUF1990 domain-containing protein n=1 Tax=Deinococcus wulumuqiensis TaxID=980427 RepID=A0A345IKJ1_9DEIO|nr:DUF1990 domain-containing protein [Deinococcus wulumuqiensis]AXH00214.1 DUF1990 domain-containing protein [Deinococcus wulumuqiensis]
MSRQQPPLYEVQKARLEAYAKAKASFDLTRTNEYTTETGWHLDDYEQELPAEAPGAPVAGGSFEAAQQVLRNYSFPPPELITGIFMPDTPLEDRVMVLRGRFLVFTFWFGVRVGQVINEQRTAPDGTPEAVWGYNYHTLEGHFEQGQIEFTIHKQLNTGRVLMRIHAVSKTGHISNPFYRLGFRLFGRSLQRRFAHSSMQRTRQQVQDMLRKGKASPPPSETPVQPVGTEQLPQGVAAQVDEHVEQRREQGEQ